MKTLLLCLTVTLLTSHVTATCSYTDEVCEFYFEIEHRLTMMRGTDKVYTMNGNLYKYDVEDESKAEPIPVEDVITADGFHKPRVVAVVNGTMPGPDIIVYENQNVYLHIHNKLMSDSLSIHIHGYPQKNMPWMDGASFITQSPILPGQTFTYKYNATDIGTYMYHAHSGAQTTMGVFGAFIIRPRRALKMVENIMVVQTWDHNKDADRQILESMYGAYDGNRPQHFDEMIDGTYSAYRSTTSGMVNGRGRYYDESGNHNGAPLTVYTVEQGTSYRFRVIGATTADPLVVSIDKHKFDVIAKDRIDIEPVNACRFIINSGDRFDIVLTANQPVDNYWIRVETLTKKKILVEAILRYKGAQEIEPSSVPNECTANEPCTVVNCPFKNWPQGKFITCVNADKLLQTPDGEYSPIVPTPEVVPGAFKEYFLNFAFHLSNDKAVGTVNGIQFKQPTVVPLLQPNEFEQDCHRANCGVDRLCHCTQTLEIGNNETVQFILMNMKQGLPVAHPIHLHGHHFHVLKIGYPQYNEEGHMIGHNMDIECEDDKERKFCNKPTWANKSWFYGNVPDLHVDRAPRMETLTIPAGGYAVVRIKANNPGLWSFHCHMENHNVGGMNILLNESFPEQPYPPEGFAEARDYRRREWSPRPLRKSPPNIGESTHDDKDESGFTKSDFWKMFIVMIVVIFAQFIITVGVFGVVHFRSRRDSRYSADALPPKYDGTK